MTKDKLSGMNYPIIMEDTFSKEFETLRKLQATLANKQLTNAELRTTCTEMAGKYEDLLHISGKMTRISDMYQKRMLRLNEALQQSEQKLKELNATKNTFFSIIAHDLKNPLTVMLGFANLLVDSWDSFAEAEKKQQVEKISEASNNLYKLLINLLEWARLQTGSISYEPAATVLNSIVDETIALLAQQAGAKQLDLHSEITANQVAVIDSRMITTVIRNLLSNAIKFTPPGGMIRITSTAAAKWLEISVIDSGTGITAANREKLFKIDTCFSTRGTANEKGTGIGLILCKEFIDQHQGRIWVESTPGQGSTFKFTVPAAGS